MASSTPSKHDRIERHLQRQRGAGVRNLVTSFGFAFGLPFAPLSAPSNQPPNDQQTTKPLNLPRKLDNAAVSEHSKGAAHDDAHGAGNKRKRANIESQQQPRKRKKTDSIEGVEDTLPVKKRGRPRKLVARSAVKAVQVPLSNTSSKPCASSGARQAVRKATTAPTSDEMLGAGCSTTVTSVQLGANVSREDQQEPVARKRGRPRKVDVTTFRETGPAKTASVRPDANQEQETQQKPAAKRRGRPKKVDVATVGNTKCLDDVPEHWMPPRAIPSEAMDEVHVPLQEARHNSRSPKIAHTGGKASKRKTKTTSANHSVGLDLDHALCEQAALTSSRPRRRAATVAMIKVAEDLVEENEPVDKKRRPEKEPNKNFSRPVAHGSPSMTRNSTVLRDSKASLATSKTSELMDKAITERDREASKHEDHKTANQLERTALAELRINLPPRSVSPRKDDSDCIPKALKHSASVLGSWHSEPVPAAPEAGRKALRRPRQTVRNSTPVGKDVALPQEVHAVLNAERMADARDAVKADADKAPNFKNCSLSTVSSSATGTAATSTRVKRGTRVQAKADLARSDDGENFEVQARHRPLAWGDVERRPRAVEAKKDNLVSQDSRLSKASRRPLRPCPAEVDLDDLLSNIADLVASRPRDLKQRM